MHGIFFVVILFILACSYDKQSGKYAYKKSLGDSIQIVSDFSIDSDLDSPIAVNNSHDLNYQLNFIPKQNLINNFVLSLQKFSSIQLRAPPYLSA